jgi:hypothetical protein
MFNVPVGDYSFFIAEYRAGQTTGCLTFNQPVTVTTASTAKVTLDQANPGVNTVAGSCTTVSISAGNGSITAYYPYDDIFIRSGPEYDTTGFTLSSGQSYTFVVPHNAWIILQATPAASFQSWATTGGVSVTYPYNSESGIQVKTDGTVTANFS